MAYSFTNARGLAFAGCFSLVSVDTDGVVRLTAPSRKGGLPRLQLCDGRRPSGVSFGAEVPKTGSADQVRLGVEGVVNRRVGSEESLG